jgi:uncharacterized protein
MAGVCKKLYSVILKTTNSCSLACDYCYINRHNSGLRHTIMPLELVRKVIVDYMAITDKLQGSEAALLFTWHGGEPLLAGMEYYEEVMKMQRCILPRSCEVLNCITTNAVVLDQRWIDFFAKNNFRVAVSLDGPEHIHNRHRFFSSGKGSFAHVMKAINLLKENNIDFGVLSVITEDLAREPQSFFEFCLAEEIFEVGFNPYITDTRWLSANEFADFNIRLFDLWYDLNNPDFRIREFADIIARIFGRRGNSCENEHCFGTHLSIDVNGDIYACDILIGNSDMYLGNAKEMNLDEVVTSSKYNRLKQLSAISLKACVKCRFYHVCQGGCMYRRYIEHKRLPGKDIYCSAKKKLISHIYHRLKETEINNSPAYHSLAAGQQV